MDVPRRRRRVRGVGGVAGRAGVVRTTRRRSRMGPALAGSQASSARAPCAHQVRRAVAPGGLLCYWCR